MMEDPRSTRKRKERVEEKAGERPIHSMADVRVREVDYAKYGVVEGVMGAKNDERSRCSIISGRWPSWVFGAEGAGLKVVELVLLNGEWEDALRRILPGMSIISMANRSDAKAPRTVELEKVDFVFTDIDPPSRVNLWSLARRAIVSSRRFRRTPQEWREKTLTVRHSGCGGVTDAVVHVHIYTQEGEPGLDVSIPVTGLRDLSALLDTRTRSGIPTAAPTKIVLDELQVMELGGRRGVYHRCGWLPAGRRDVQVITPNAFSPTKWCKRKLGCDEWLQVLDFPVGVMKALEKKEKELLVKDKSVLPLKVLSAVSRELQLRCTVTDSAAHAEEVEKVLETGGHGMGGVVGNVEAVPMIEVGIPKPAVEIDRMAMATKSDDAEVPEYLWDDRLLAGLELTKTTEALRALGKLRELFLRWWKRKVTSSFLVWWLSRRHKGAQMITPSRLIHFDPRSARYAWRAKGQKQYKVMRNQRRAVDRSLAEDAADAIRRSSNSSWWEWTDGSFPFFWRWPEWYQTQVREGCNPWMSGDIPKCRIPQRKDKDESVYQGMRKKLEVSIGKGYLEIGLIHSLTSYFAVPKGLDDIRMVYDGTKSGLNDAMFAPWFPLPTVEQLLRVVDCGSYMGDIDVGEMFLNFIMHKSLRVLLE
mmetsp:Transcript_8332/g.12121  ORF Transcript_8332/g.12121 Transcript_8332/m.12121 type:complete len:644 (-) Transcript_8332:24-1955(-)